MRVILTLIITFSAIILAFFEAFYGLLGYAFWSYTFPEKITWGQLPLERLSYIMGLVVVITTLAQKKKIFVNNKISFLIIIFWCFSFLGLLTAGQNMESKFQFPFFSRVILITLIIPVLTDDIKKIRYYLWAIAIFIGLVAAQSGIAGTLRGEIGGAKSGFGGVIGDRNFMAVILCAIIPLVYYLGSAENDRRLKFLLRGILLGDVLALVLTYARAGFLGLSAVIIFIFLKSKRKFVMALVSSIFVIIAVFYIIPPQYFERLSTMSKIDLEEEDADLSVVGRIVAWRSAVEMIKENPFSGVGFYNSATVIENYPDPETGIILKRRALHNTILQVGAELGLIALFIYFLIFFLAYRNLGAIRRRARANELPGQFDAYASMLQVAFVGFFSCAFFVNSAFIDIGWHLVGLSIALELITKREIKQQRQESPLITA